jgi:hypothetical protein
MACELTLGRLVFGQHFTGARDYFVRQARELRHFNAVAAVGRTGLDFAQEGDSAAGFFYRDMIILHS